MKDAAERNRISGEPALGPLQEAVNPPAAGEADEPRPPALEVTPRNVAALAIFLVISLAALYVLLPQLTLGVLLTGGMFAGYVTMFRGVFVRAESCSRIGWRESYQITMAGLAASRLFAAGGAGGLVLTAWALRRSGMRPREVADKTLAFLILTYFPYVVAVIVCGFGLHFGLFAGPAPLAFTLIPAVVASIVLAIGLLIALVPTDLQRRLEGFAHRKGRLGRFAQRAANLPAASSAGMRDALEHVRSGDPALLGAITFWAFQIAVLWAGFHAFGQAPPLAVLVQAFFIGMLGNLLPMPGGVGGVEGGMVGAYAAFGVDFDLALVAVLVYRAFTFWLPLVPGVIAYFRLRRTVEGWKQEPTASATA
jgi:uncharacterized protein (TIRG00374 family)